ncbi:hypothetical protein GEOBRER4_n1986 [Citrifermentans bremense]|uniref:Uncharacterized protein n=1 Tax=Citrifermentans bremense TaxID=60035 RepID=A0A7R7FT60_9BACT|nr:hypothetical protein GEOBRER4_n1986 [Citrifermentans bremense]
MSALFSCLFDRSIFFSHHWTILLYAMKALASSEPKTLLSLKSDIELVTLKQLNECLRGVHATH